MAQKNIMSNLLKSKIVLGFMVLAIAFVGFGMVATSHANAATCDLGSTTLKQGMRGAAVECLQNMLAVSPQTGYFGTITKAKVMAFQTNKGLKADGVVGAMTRASLAGTEVSEGNYPAGCSSNAGFSSTTGLPCTSGVSYPAGCTSAVGFSSTTGMTCTGTPVVTYPAGCVAGSLFSSTTGQSCTGTVGTVNGTNGALIASQSSAVSAGVTINAGATANLDAIKLQATSGPVQVNSVDAHFSVRPWLYFSQVTLSSNGTILATLPLTSANSTEITVGSDYLLNFSGLNLTVTPGTNPDLVLAGTSISGTNRLPATIAMVLGNIKSVNGSGWTDSVGPTAAPTTNNYGVGLNYVTLSATGSVATIYANLSNISPSTSQVAVSSTSGTTTSQVVLGAFSLKSTNTASTVNTLNVSVKTSGSLNSLAAAQTAFSNIKLYGPGCTSGCGGSLAATGSNGAAASTVSGVVGVISFTNLTAPLTQDSWTDFTIKADVAGQTSGTVSLVLDPTDNASVNNTTVYTKNIVGVDANYDALVMGTTSGVLSNTLTMTSNAVVLSSLSFATVGSAIQGTVGTGTTAVSIGYSTGLTFTLTNNGNNNLYVSSTVVNLVTMDNSAFPGGTPIGTTSMGTVINTTTVNGDLAGSYYVLPVGQSRTFTLNGALYGNYTGTTLAHGAYNYKLANITYYDTAAHAAAATNATSTGYAYIVSSTLPVTIAPTL